jgi:cysteine desulfurase
MDSIYLDNNAATPLLPAVAAAMTPFWFDAAGNPASAHRFGRRARQALEDTREQTAALLGAHADEVVFTSGATEANNLALFGQCGDPPAHLLASPIEHPSVSEPLQRLTHSGFALDFLPVDAQGQVVVDALADRLRPETRLVAVMLANHETGAVQPVRALVEQLEGRTTLHCDAVQAVGKLAVDFHALGVTTLALSAHKFHGPKGIGALLVRRGAALMPRLWGGHQQRGLRPGTEPVALVVGLACALALACREREARQAHIVDLRRRFLDVVRAGAEPVALNGPAEGGMPHTLNLSFPGLEAAALLMALDLTGVACSAGSACSSGSLLPSPVLKAMAVGEERLRSAVRFSFSALLRADEVEEAARRVVAVVRRLRGTSPS